MAEHRWLPLSQNKLNDLEKGLNFRLGGEYLDHKTCTVVDTNITAVVVDTDKMFRQADAQNVPLNKWYIDITKLKWHLDGRGPNIITKINDRFGVDVKQYISNKAVLQSERVIYNPDV